ncbi:MAG: PAS domain-containing sensor histidine kinase, partial [Flavobacteriales bacterium]
MSHKAPPLPSTDPASDKDGLLMPDMVTQGSVFLDEDLRVLGADSLFYSSFNVTPEETEGRLLQELGDGQWGSSALRQLLQNVVTEDRSFTDHEVVHLFPKGVGRRYMLLHGGRPGRAAHPTALVTLGFDDNTARRNAMEALRHTEVRYRRLFETAKDGILILDAHSGHIVDANAFMEGLVGLEAGQLMGKQLYEIGLFKDIAANKAAFIELQRNRYIRYEHLPVRNNRGETVHVEFIANVYQEDDRLVAQCNVRDISLRVQLEKKVAEQGLILADEARNKDEFLAMLSHELRNPLAPIRSAMHLLKLQQTTAIDPIQRQAMDVIDRQVGNLTKLVNDLLEVSRVLNGRVHLNMQTVDIQEVVEHAVQTVRPLIDQHRHTLVIHACDQPMWVRADALRMEEVFINLLTNAVKYTPADGNIEVECHSDKDEVRVDIRDNGIGLQPQVLPHVFDLFVQADRSLDRAEGGLGVGLSLAHRLVSLQGGSIHASSAGLGKGSTFSVRMPLIVTPQPASGTPPLGVASAVNAGS